MHLQYADVLSYLSISDMSLPFLHKKEACLSRALHECCFSCELESTYGNGFLIELRERGNKGTGSSYPHADVGPRVGSKM